MVTSPYEWEVLEWHEKHQTNKDICFHITLTIFFFLLQVLSDSAVMGIIIGLSLALPVLVLTTMNIIIGFIAWMVIVMVTVCVLGFIPLLGWKLGVSFHLDFCAVVFLCKKSQTKTKIQKIHVHKLKTSKQTTRCNKFLSIAIW